MTLVLGMAISVAALRHMLPAKAADVLQAKEFRLLQVKGVRPLDAGIGNNELGPCRMVHAQHCHVTFQEQHRPFAVCVSNMALLPEGRC